MHSTEWLLAQRRMAAQWAQDTLREDCIIFDGETTGTGPRDEFVQVAAIDASGAILLDTRIRPRQRIDPGAARVHGLTAETLTDAPSFKDVYPHLVATLAGRCVVAYNAEFDARVLDQACERYGLPEVYADWECAMRQYAQFRGAWNNERNSFRWHKLTDALRHEQIPPAGAHAALGDCVLTLRLMQAMAAWLDADGADRLVG